MEVYQFVDDFYLKDAIGNYVLMINDFLNKNNIRSFIFTNNFDTGLKEKCFHYLDFPLVSNPNGLIFFHFSIYSEILPYLVKIPNKKILIFHNITPSEFFPESHLKSLLKKARDQSVLINKNFDFAICDSNFNKKVLQEYGYKKKTIILPPFISLLKRFGKYKYKIKRDKKIKKIIHVGQFLYHKRIDDVVKIFNYYQKYFNKNAELYLIGGYYSYEDYFNCLREISAGNQSIHFTGKISDKELGYHYSSADLFLSMSEHEGFGIPYIEAMYFKLPIIAYNSGATLETIAGGGIIVQHKNYFFVSALIDRVITDKQIQKIITKNQLKELKRYDYKLIQNKLLKCLMKN